MASDGGALIAFDRGEKGWLIDDFAVTDDAWPTTGSALLRSALDRLGANLTVVCGQRDEPKRDARRQFGLQIHEEWWVRSPNPSAEPTDSSTADFSANVISAPPDYDPGGSILMTDVVGATAQAVDGLVAFEATQRVAVIVVTVSAHDRVRRELLSTRGFTVVSEWYRSA